MMLATIRRPSSRRSAFTLLEVLVVVAILVILASVATVATTRYLEDAKKTRAQLGCRGIAQAIEAYKTAPGNPMNEDPTSLQDLLTPPFGGTGFLKNGQEDLIDPWNQPYQMTQFQQGDGSVIIQVFTRSTNDQVPISQFGIGPNSRVNQ
jgi:general secretion pathway protein G